MTEAFDYSARAVAAALSPRPDALSSTTALLTEGGDARIVPADTIRAATRRGEFACLGFQQSPPYS